MDSENGRWVTINGRRVFIRTNQHPMDAFIRQQTIGKENKYEDGELEEENTQFVFDENKKEFVKKTTPTKYQLNNGKSIEFMNEKEYKKMANDFLNSLTDEEKQAINVWVGDPKSISKNSIFNNQDNTEEIIESIFNNKGVELKQDTLLYRRAYDYYIDIENGFNTRRFLSTSAYDKIPKTMPSGKPFGQKELYIIAPKGTRVLPIEKVAVEMTPYADEKRMYARQHEIMLDKGTGLQLVKDLSNYEYDPFEDKKNLNKEKYVLQITKDKYNKRDYTRKEYQFQERNRFGLETYNVKKGNKIIEIQEINPSARGHTQYTRKDIKYRVFDLAIKGLPEYYDSYDEAMKMINKHL